MTLQVTEESSVAGSKLNVAKKRIKRLEEVLDTLTLVVGLTPIVGNKDALQEAMDMARSELKAKEAA